MVDVQFSEETAYARPSVGPKAPPLIGLLMRAGFAKDQRQAEQLLIGVAVAAVLVAIAIWLFAGSSANEPVPGPLEQALVPGQRAVPTPSR